MDLLPDFRDPLSALADSNAEYLVRTVPGVDFAVAHARREQASWDGVPVSVISFDDLIASKKAAGREKDERDVRALLRARKSH